MLPVFPGEAKRPDNDTSKEEGSQKMTPDIDGLIVKTKPGLQDEVKRKTDLPVTRGDSRRGVNGMGVVIGQEKKRLVALCIFDATSGHDDPPPSVQPGSLLPHRHLRLLDRALRRAKPSSHKAGTTFRVRPNLARI